MKRLIRLFCILVIMSSIGIGFANWNFQSDTNINNQINVLVVKPNLKQTWTNSDKLTDDAYEFATDFMQAINNPTSAEGQAWTKAWNEKHTL